MISTVACFSFKKLLSETKLILFAVNFKLKFNFNRCLFCKQKLLLRISKSIFPLIVFDAWFPNSIKIQFPILAFNRRSRFNSWRGTISVRVKQASYMYCMRSWNVRRIPTVELKLWRMKLRIREIFIFINSVMPFFWCYCCSINGFCCVWLKFSCFLFPLILRRIFQWSWTTIK